MFSPYLSDDATGLRHQWPGRCEHRNNWSDMCHRHLQPVLCLSIQDSQRWAEVNETEHIIRHHINWLLVFLSHVRSSQSIVVWFSTRINTMLGVACCRSDTTMGVTCCISDTWITDVNTYVQAMSTAQRRSNVVYSRNWYTNVHKLRDRDDVIRYLEHNRHIDRLSLFRGIVQLRTIVLSQIAEKSICLLC